MKVKRILSVLLALCMLGSFAVCFAVAGDANVVIGKAYISFVDNGVRTEAGVNFPDALGTIFNRSEVELHAGDTIADVTRRFVEDVKGGKANIIPTSWGTLYLESIKNVITDSGVTLDSFGEKDAGAVSGWMYRLNNQFSNTAIDKAPVDIGDEIAWMYSCQIGADIGGDFNETSAAITGLTFSAGSLAPAFSTGVKDYTLNLPANVTAIKVEAELKDYFTETTYTLVHGGKSVDYKYYRDIPVSDGDKIVISTKKTTEQYDASYNYLGTVTDSDSVTITIAQAQSTPTNFIRAIIQAIIAFIKGLFANLGNIGK